MGYLHEGHLSLVDIAREHSSFIVLTVFVNPLQFGPGEDFEMYPRDLERDIRLASERGVDLFFAPDVVELYPEKNLTFVEVTKITDGLCGERRPGHFRGVMTVVAKLFNIVEPDVSVFGQKDAQQALAIKRMAMDLNFRGDVVIGPTIREEDGLAMSSRNKYLSENDRNQAVRIYQSLLEAKRLIREGERDATKLKNAMVTTLHRASQIKIDYVSITDTHMLVEHERISGEVLIAVAAFVGKTRLIDNIMITV
jgi:pantoate--beta-alanine ligase